MRGWLLIVGLSMAAAGCDRVLGLGNIKPLPPDAGPATFVQSNSAVAPAMGTTLALAFGQPPAPHDLLVVTVATWHNTLTTVSDSAGNSYLRTPVNPVLSDGYSELWILYASDVATASPFTIQIVTTADPSLPSNNDLSVTAHEYAGISGAMGFDGIASAHDVGTGDPVMESCGSAMLSSDREVEVAALTHDFTGTSSAGPGFTVRAIATEDNTCCTTLVTADNVRTPVASASFTTSVVSGSSRAWACAMVTFPY